MRTTLTATPKHFVAVDMGSNSFHLVIAREQDGSIQILHKEKRLVQLAEGLDQDNRLDNDAIARGLACLKDFNLRFSTLDQARVRLVATHTLRVARNREAFIEAARAIMPYPVEVVSGHEEARLIYKGIAHSQELAERNLIIDIGGGSTEVVLGHKTQAQILSSLRCGCVSYNQKYFVDGKLTLENFRAAQAAADKQFASLAKEYFSGQWDLTLGSSGSVKAICEAMQHFFNDETITLPRLKQLKQQLLDWGHVDQIELPQVDSKRAPLLPAGLAILISFFKRLPITELQFAQGALREGVLYELAGISQFGDVSGRTVESMAKLYHVDLNHAAKVATSAKQLFDAVADCWQLEPWRSLLEHAVKLHEIGIHINSRAHHKHGAYIIANSDLPGFSQEQQQLLALLIGNQRKKPNLEALAQLEPAQKLRLIRLMALLRLAVLLNLGRIARSLKITRVKPTATGMQISLPEPRQRISLFAKDLQREQKQLAQLGFELQISYADN
ncbi:exopolyphosphatase [Shewanella algae]|nr:exopolyphosphatase [Shewanella algae]MBO2560831.1 exopolyphosphatase [Shewanella algae]MBO2582132.1 exopolyphosphatase [Shewanella algae]MBO2687738.1 exopolyphosphatase [Shewanella algae]PST66756.1 exopolyphosphatase [Shewanella algae]